MADKIIRVWGTADSHTLEFTNILGDQWGCKSIPPDMTDGVYSCEIWAKSDSNEIAHWTGWLYLCNGVCHLDINTSNYRFDTYLSSKLDTYINEYVFETEYICLKMSYFTNEYNFNTDCSNLNLTYSTSNYCLEYSTSKLYTYYSVGIHEIDEFKCTKLIPSVNEYSFNYRKCKHKWGD